MSYQRINPLESRIAKLEKTVALYGTMILIIYVPVILGGVALAVYYFKGAGPK